MLLQQLSSPASLCVHHHAASLCYHPLFGCSMTTIVAHARAPSVFPLLGPFSGRIPVNGLATSRRRRQPQSELRTVDVSSPWLNFHQFVSSTPTSSGAPSRLCIFSGTSTCSSIHGFFYSTLLTTIAQPTCEQCGVLHVVISFRSPFRASSCEPASSPERRHRSAAMRRCAVSVSHAARASVPITDGTLTILTNRFQPQASIRRTAISAC